MVGVVLFSVAYLASGHDESDELLQASKVLPKVAVPEGTLLQANAVPELCLTFQSRCQATTPPTWTSTIANMKTGFEVCCVSGGHSDAACQAFGSEIFDSVVSSDFNIVHHAGLCNEVMKLYDAHSYWKAEHRASLLQSNESCDEIIEDRALKAANRLLDAHEGRAGMPSLIETTPAFALALFATAGPSLVMLTQTIAAVMKTTCDGKPR